MPDENSEIETAVWAISETDESALDAYEDFPTLYRKEMFEITINGIPKQALVYIMNDGAKKALPCEAYFNCVLDGYVDCGIDTEQLFNAMFDAKQL